MVGQSLDRNIVNIVYDNLVADEMEAGEELVGEEALLAHFQAPLVDKRPARARASIHSAA